LLCADALANPVIVQPSSSDSQTETDTARQLSPQKPRRENQHMRDLGLSFYPQCRPASRRLKKATKAEILTSSPFKKSLEDKLSGGSKKGKERRQAWTGSKSKQDIAATATVSSQEWQC